MMGLRLGVRSAYVALAITVWFATLAVLANTSLDQTQVLDAMQWLIGALIAAITGDSVRPSGQAQSAFKVQSVQPEPVVEAA